LERAEKRLDRLPPLVRERITLWQGALTYRDARLTGYDASVLMEVIEHIDEPRLEAMEQAVFGAAQPAMVIITTPNADYNPTWESLPAGAMRHRDHRFEWSRSAFEAWAGRVADVYGYEVAFAPIGPVDAELGSPTQMGIFTRDK
jgi:3' terminal RNA ribose 2'-O-methyltransferase Hen1